MHRNQGHARRTIERFFAMALRKGKIIDVQTYTEDGSRYIKKIFDRLSLETGVKVEEDQLELADITNQL